MKTLVACIQCDRLNRVPLDKAAISQPVCGHCKSELPWSEGVQEVSGTGLSALLRNA